MKTIRVVGLVCCGVLCVLPGVASAQQLDPFESFLVSAQDAQARSDFQTAAKFYRQAVVLHPEIPELQANLGLMYYQTGKDEQARAAFHEALRLEPRLFVPNLFLGLVSVRSRRFGEAIVYFNRAALANPADVQVQLGLGEAYTGSGKPRLATAAYSRAAKVNPRNANAWYHLGVSYLELVEADARILLKKHKDSGYTRGLMAETFAEQGALIQAEDAYKKMLALSKFPPGAHVGYGFVLLNRHDLAGAERELNAELAATPGSLLAKLGIARLHLEHAEAERAAQEIVEIEKADRGFLRANASLLNRRLPGSKRANLLSALEKRQATAGVSPEIVALFRQSASDGTTTPAAGQATDGRRISGTKVPASDPAKLYDRGSYGECNDVLAPRLKQLSAKQLQLLASCAYLTGNYSNALNAAAGLAQNPLTEAEGLYWETKSAQMLATQSLACASATDPNSPKLHVLLGDIYRQQKSFPDAEQEYRKALALSPGDTGAQFGLSLAMLASGQNDEALSLAQAALEKNPDDPELNAVMGEILCARNEYADAEPFLKKSLNTKPEFVSRVHALLGKVYAKTNRTQGAIAEFRLALDSDKDGSLHYQIARLYLKVGNRALANQAFEMSKRIQREGLMRATVAMEQGRNDTDSQ